VPSDGTSSRAARRQTTLRVWPLVALGLYFALMAAQAALLAPSGRSDDLESLLMSQSLEWGYESKNPPLFYWLAHAATELAGRTPATIYTLRLAAIFLTYAGLYALAARLQPDPLLAGCAGFAMLATVHFHWYTLFYLTNTALAMALAPVAVLALLRIADRPDRRSYLGFGVVLGLGLLCRYNFAVFAAALVLAALAAPEWRARLLRPRALISVATVLLMLAPHLVWVVDNLPALAEQVGAQLADGTHGYSARALEGARELVEAIVSILLLPLGLLALACFPRAFRRIDVADPARASEIALVGRTVVLTIGLIAAYVALGSDYVQEHHLFVLIFAPVWLIARLKPGMLRPLAARVFAGSLAGCAALAMVAYPLDHRRDVARCDDCEEYQPMAAYAAAARAAGFSTGTIHALSTRQAFPTPALLGAFPDARMTAAHYTVHTPPANPSPGACLLVWSAADQPPDPRTPVPGLGLPLPAGAVFGAAEGSLRLSDRPARGMGFALVPEGLGDCR
jgi:4-amino-4-deoxy-L-arabinose transferase-like glycosyltransferase